MLDKVKMPEDKSAAVSNNTCKPKLNDNMMKAFNDFKKLCNHPNFTLEIKKKVLDYLDYKLRIINESKLINNPEHKCDNCGTKFAHRQSRDRHIKLNRCNMKLEI